MAALLVAVGVIAVTAGVALPAWQTAIRREREAELVFRGEQYVQAIRLFQRRYAGTFPPDVDALVTQRFLRRRYVDPITNTEFRVLYAAPLQSGRSEYASAAVGTGGTVGLAGADARRPGQVGRGGVIGVVSTSTMESVRWYRGHRRYNEWTFVVSQTEGRPR
jgi:type II secretory pathway pseudopilin PulG